jgi:UDP-N-acetylmuramate dehydrogenase
VGGPADALVTVRSEDELAGVLALADRHGTPTTVLGNGSNVLVSDAGIEGVVLRLAGDLTASEASGGVLTVGAGLRLAVLLHRAEKASWGGLACLAGIPGTVGGAVRMNAGTSLGEIGDILVDVRAVDARGHRHVLTRDDLAPVYRHTQLSEGTVLTQARLRIREGDADSVAEVRTFLDRRKATQPLDQPSCGSTFTNPPGDHAGRLIDAAGLKGHRIGGAEVSVKHANFVLNTGGATAVDIRGLIDHVRAEVHTRFGVELTPEVVFLGRW